MQPQVAKLIAAAEDDALERAAMVAESMRLPSPEPGPGADLILHRNLDARFTANCIRALKHKGNT